MSFTGIGKACPSPEFLNVANKSFNAIHENKILAKISEFIVLSKTAFKYRYI